MSRIEDIKRDLPGLRKHFGTNYGWPKDIEYLLRIAEASQELFKPENDAIIQVCMAKLEWALEAE